MLDFRHRQQDLVSGEEVLRTHDRRRQVEEEAELKRLRIIRGALRTTAKGLGLLFHPPPQRLVVPP